MNFAIGRRANYRREGDRRRDLGDWAGAAQAYRRHLSDHPDDVAIHVQLGHALKERERLSDAADAYGTAVALAPEDIDALRHLADALRRLGRKEEALQSYDRLTTLAPERDLIDTARLLRRELGITTSAAVSADAVFMSVQDLFGYLWAHPTMSGIQRVQAGIALFAIVDPEIDVRFILNGPIGGSALKPGQFLMLDSGAFRQMLGYASGAQVDHDTLRSMLKACEEEAEIVEPEAGHTIVLLGAFWGAGNSAQQFVASRRRGVRIAAYIYDIIPITHPEFCDDALVASFTRAFCELRPIVDLMLTISEATRREVERFIADHGGDPIETHAVPLAHHLTADAPAGDAAWPQKLESVRGRRFAVYVSTIEARKNHLYAVNAWRELIAQGVDVPDLVFVGRRGWKIAGLEELLASTRNLSGRVHIVHGLSDGELSEVYRRCDFSIFTSFVEGWGLPIGESLYYGRPCISSDTASMPEVGGDLVDYVDPLNLRDGIEVFRRMITDDAYRARRTAEIAERFRCRSWADVAEDFLGRIKAFRKQPVEDWSFAVAEGTLLRFDLGTDEAIDLGTYFHTPDRLVIDPSAFYPAEGHGAWLRGTSQVLQVPTSLHEGEEVLVYLHTNVAPWHGEAILTIEGGGTAGAQRDRRAPAPVRTALSTLARSPVIRLRARIGTGGMLCLRVTVEGYFAMPEGDHRVFVLGLRSIGFARPASIQKRQELMEATFLGSGLL